MRSEKAKTAGRKTPVGPSREFNEREVCPHLAAMRELYSLLIACVANDGARTCHVFAVPDEKQLNAMLAVAMSEGFQFESDSKALTGTTAISVWRKA